MRRDGNVMIAVDTAGRMLELAQLLVGSPCNLATSVTRHLYACQEG